MAPRIFPSEHDQSGRGSTGRNSGERPLVSVVIPAYNAVDRLPTALDSVRAQTYPSDRLEIIVVDDGSEDATAERARECLSSSAASTEVLSIENSGPSRARNVGWQTASGDWIQFLDDDDRIAPNKIETQIREAVDADPNVAIVHSDWERRGRTEDGRWECLHTAHPRIGPDDPLKDLLSADGFIHVGSGLLRRSWLDAVDGFVERYRVVEDVHLMLRIAMAGGQFHHVSSEGPLFFYRQREGSLSRRSNAAFAHGCKRNVRLVEKYWTRHNALTPERVQFLTRAYFYTARELATCDWQGCMDVWKHIQKLDPTAVPPKPASLRLLTRMIGYPAAQRIVAWGKRTRDALRSMVPTSPLRLS